jgi:hypothetical protein
VVTPTLVLLLVMATIGAIDGTYYHTYKFRLFEQPSARFETITHVVRAFSLAAALWVLAHRIPVGGWYWAIVALFTFDLVDDVVDVLIEPRSRAPLGGLPPLEYLIHMISIALSGGAWATFVLAGWATRHQPAALVPFDVPWWLLWYARIVAVGALLMGVGDSIRLVLSRRATAKHA